MKSLLAELNMRYFNSANGLFTLADVHINICESRYCFSFSYLTFAFSSRVNLLSNEVIRKAISFCLFNEGISITRDAISEI